MGSCSKTTKGCLMVTGLIYWGAAAALWFLGAWVFKTYNHFDEIAEADLTLLPASIIIGVGIFMFVIGVLSCVAACKENKLLLSVFFCLVLVVFLGEVVAAVLGYVYRHKIEDSVNDGLKDAMDSYNVTVKQEQMDYLQKELHCCGIHNASDWFESAYWKVNHTKGQVPESCCHGLSANSTCSFENPDWAKHGYQEGCLNKLENKFRDNLIYIAGTMVGFAVVQLLALLSTCILVCRTKGVRNYQRMEEPIGGGLRV